MSETHSKLPLQALLSSSTLAGLTLAISCLKEEDFRGVRGGVENKRLSGTGTAPEEMQMVNRFKERVHKEGFSCQHHLWKFTFILSYSFILKTKVKKTSKYVKSLSLTVLNLSFKELTLI